MDINPQIESKINTNKKWDNMSISDIAKEITGAKETSDNQSIAELLNVNAENYKAIPFSNLVLSTRAFNCLNRYLNSPFLPEDSGRDSIGDLLAMTVKEYTDVRNLGTNCFVEVLELLTKFVKSYKIGK